MSRNPGLVARNDGDHEKALQAGGKTLESAYQVPYLEHACMEPMNATAHITRDACTMDPHQNPGGSLEMAGRLTGLPPSASRSTRRSSAAGSGGAASATS